MELTNRALLSPVTEAAGQGTRCVWPDIVRCDLRGRCVDCVRRDTSVYGISLLLVYYGSAVGVL